MTKVPSAPSVCSTGVPGRRERHESVSGSVGRLLFVKASPRKSTMLRAIGLAAMIVVLGVFIPRVLDAIELFLLTTLERATEFVDALPPL